MSITLIENLPNEFFFGIFEYLDGYEIYQTFSNLNYRFQQLINSSSLLLKFNYHCLTSDKIHMNNFKQFLLNHKHQIVSFYIQKNEFFSSFSIDSSFHHLQLLVIEKIPPTSLISLLINLSSLPHLTSLIIDIQYAVRDLTEVYQLIFILPKLKYLKCSANEHFTSISLPIANHGQFSTIKHLVINHECTFNTLCILISYTPQLYHLSLMNLSENDSDDEIVLPVSCSNLTYLSIKICSITFDELKIFIIDTKCNLKFLRIISESDYNDYINDEQWEKLIVNYLPKLEKFYVEYRQDIDPESESLGNFQPPDQFNSLFWNQRKWILDIEMNGMEYIYSVHSYKERWYDIDPANEISNSTRLKITNLPDDDDDDDDDLMMVLDLIIRDVLSITQIYHLEISKENISSSILLKIINKFSALDTLKISSLELSESKYSSIENKYSHFKSKKNKITKIYLEKMNEIEEIYFLLKLCPHIEYLKIGFMHNMDIELFMKDILKKINNVCNQYLQSLCLHIPTANDEMIEKLKEMINRKKLLRDFSIKYVIDNIYLQWK
ncbi:unnamed protein product [Rotaria sordida]|uniref:F-box domain-containing protein n=1 Tax=Rotaria sordida TaxID=392033 RepID=A0A814WEF2_9BILA|nr:unnamed protein product [Rotaria sordida]CAF1200297.1 unnamed protein product [Rotaria sordida]